MQRLETSRAPDAASLVSTAGSQYPWYKLKLTCSPEYSELESERGFVFQYAPFTSTPARMGETCWRPR
jgi:hypothetical protein